MKKYIVPLLLAAFLLLANVTFIAKAAEIDPVKQGQEVAAKAAAVAFPSNGSEYIGDCPACGKEVTWTALKDTGENQSLSNGQHVYLYEDISVTGAVAAISGPSSNGTKACLHLNGKTVTSSGYYAIFGSSGVLNIMGDGYVKGNKSGETYGSAIHINGSGTASAVNIYGGEYSQIQATQTSNVLGVYNNGGIINMYGGKVIANSAGSAVFLNGDMNYTSALFNLYGGTINATATGEVALDMEAADTLASTSGSNAGRTVELAYHIYGGQITGGSGGTLVARKNGVIQIAGGTVTGGTVSGDGGSIVVEAEGKLEMTGGTVTGGNAVNGGNIYIGENGTATISGGTVTDGTASENGGNIFVDTDGTFTMAGGVVADGYAYNGGNVSAYYAAASLKDAVVSKGISQNQGGNIYLYRSELTIEEGTQITDGESKTRCGSLRCLYSKVVMTGGTISGGKAATDGMVNVWASGSKSNPANFYLLGGRIDCADNRHYTAIYYADYSNLYLGGSAVISDTNKSNAGIAAKNNTAMLYICDGWYGSADIKFPGNYALGTELPETVARLVTLHDDLSITAGGNYTGRLTQRNTAVGDIFGLADGSLIVGGTVLVDSAGNLTPTTAPLADWNTGKYTHIKLYSAVSFEDLAEKQIVVDLNGHDLTVGGTGTLQPFDSANDGYNAAACGTVTNNGSIAVAESVLAPNGNQYIAITDGAATTMHRLDMQITTVSLRTTAAGLYYTATYNCDSALETAVKSYGIVLSAHNMPGADFLTQAEAADINRCTVAAAPFKSGVMATSGSVFGIMKENRAAELNARYGEVEIYANPYIRLDTDGETCYVGDNANAGKTVESQDFNGVAYSLHDMVDTLDDSYYLYTEEERLQLDQFCTDWKAKGMDWSFINIGATASKIDNGELVFRDGSNVAVCPTCKEEKIWTKITEDAAIIATNGEHYYLDGDFTYTGTESYFFRGPSGSGTACLHLQGYDLTAIHTTAIRGYQGILNIMGTGTVTGYTEKETNGAAVFISTGSTKGTVNLYGGTYVKSAACTTGAVVAIGDSGGQVNVYAQAKVVGDETGYGVYVDAATRAPARFGVHGGTVTGGEIRYAGSETKLCALDVTGNAKISKVTIPVNATANLSGAPMIDRLNLSNGVRITVGQLSKGANITVKATGVFTETSDGAATYGAYFQPAVATDSIQVENGQLCYVINYEPYRIPWELDVVEQAKADGKIHYYFMAGEGLEVEPGSAQTDKWGDSCLVVFPNGETMLIDSGMPDMAPLLWRNLERLGVNTLDHLMITHYHNDHYGGVFGSTTDGVTFRETGFLDKITVKHVYHHGIEAKNHYGYQLVSGVCVQRNIPTTILERGMVETVGGISMEVIWPDVGANQSTISTGQINDSSIVVRFDYGEHSALFTGDVYVAGETEILTIVDHAKLDVDLLKVPHHGWSTSSSEAFIQAISPELGVITGRQEKIAAIKNRYTALGVPLAADIDCGYVHVSADADGNMEYETSR